MPNETERSSTTAAGRPCTLFYHPGAGERAWDAQQIIAALRAAGFEPTLSEREEDDWEADVAATKELAIVAGGDGSIAMVAEMIGDRDLPLAILPTGSGNNIARSLGILGPLEEIIPRLAHARTGPLRLCRAKGPWGERVLIEGIGLGAQAHSVLELQEEKLDGVEKLLRGRDSFFSSIEAQEPLDLGLTVDDRLVEGAFLIVEILNLPMVGPNLRLVPDTDLAGEELGVALLPAGEREAMTDWLARGGVGIAPLRRVHGRRIVIEGGRQPLRLGDKSIDWDGSRVEIAAVPHRIRVLRPGDGR